MSIYGNNHFYFRRSAIEDVPREDEEAMVAAHEARLTRLGKEEESSDAENPGKTNKQKANKLKRDEAAETRRWNVRGKGGWEGGLGHWDEAEGGEPASPQHFLRRGKHHSCSQIMPGTRETPCAHPASCLIFGLFFTTKAA